MTPDGQESHWWRGCKTLTEGAKLECTEHKFVHHEHEYLVDECVCDEDLCNAKMDPIPQTSTSPLTTITTTEGVTIVYTLFYFRCNLDLIRIFHDLDITRVRFCT